MSEKMKPGALSVDELPVLRRPRQRPRGAMAKYLGRRLDSMQIGRNNSDFLEPEQVEMYRNVQAWVVTPLMGARITVGSDSELSGALLVLLGSTLPGIAWDDVEVSPLHLRKYFFMHTSVPAPRNEATDQPMSIEIFGPMTSIRGLDGTYEAALSKIWPEDGHWVGRVRDEVNALERNYFPNGKDILKMSLTGLFTIQITEAVYSNLRIVNVGGGIYE